MKSRFAILALVVAAALAVPGIAVAQAKPDFSGKWVQDLEKSDPMRGPGGGGGPATPATLTITQTAADLTIETTRGANTSKAVYKLDGTESVNAGARGGQAKTKSHFEGSTLVTEGTQTMTTPMGEMTMEMKEVRSIEADGTMLVQTTTKSPRGENTRKTVFKKG